MFWSAFTDPKNPTLSRVADHIEYVASKAHVGIGSDFGKYSFTPRSCTLKEQQTAYHPLLKVWKTLASTLTLVTEMLVRGWSDTEVIGLMGGNIMRVMDHVDEVAAQMTGEHASAEVYDERTDLPALSQPGWQQYLPDSVKQYSAERDTK